MKFGSREICNVVFRAKAATRIGNQTFVKGQPVLYIDSAKTSTVEGAATTVYAQGGRGNTRLIAWEGEKTLTFTVEDALLSPISFAMLSGAGLFKGKDGEETVHVHMTTYAQVDNAEIDLTDALGVNDKICKTAPIYVMKTETDGSITGELVPVKLDDSGKKLVPQEGASFDKSVIGTTVMVDYYILKSGSTVSELIIDAENFAGYYYVEADTLFKRQSDGANMPANLTLPNVKIQSNFTFSMAATGDPSTFTFTMDAMPGYTYFNKTKKVLCVIQIIEDSEEGTKPTESVMTHNEAEVIDESAQDSTPLAEYDMSSVKWPTETSKTHTGSEIKMELEGLPSGVTASYTGNTGTDTGTYTATVIGFEYDTTTHVEPKLPKGVAKSITWKIV